MSLDRRDSSDLGETNAGSAGRGQGSKETSPTRETTKSPFLGSPTSNTAHARQTSQYFPQDDPEEFGSIRQSRNVSYALPNETNNLGSHPADGGRPVQGTSGGSGSGVDLSTMTTKHSNNNNTKKLRFGTIKKKVNFDENMSGLGRKLSKKFPVLKPFIDIDSGPEISTSSRVLYANQPLPEEDLDPKSHMPKANYPRNKIRTSKYTPLSFVPKNLFFQFHNVANIYFLFIVILSAFEIFGVQNPGLSAVPIIAIVIITAIKDAIEDYRRTVLDGELNNTLTTRLNNYNNPNVVEGNVSPWRRFKKASTKISKKMLHAIINLFKKKSKKSTSSREQMAPTNLELQSVVSQSTYRTQISSVYNDEVPGSDLPSVREIPSNAATARQKLSKQSSSAQKSDSTTTEFGSVIDRTHDCPGVARFKRDFWKNVKCGDIVKIFDDEEVPADVVVLSTSDADGACFIETRNLDGETNLKVRQSLRSTGSIKRTRDIEQSVFKIETEAPNPALYTFNGVLHWDQRKDANSLVSDYERRSEAITINNLLLRGSSLRNTKWIIGLVVYTGAETKIMLNAGATPAKRSRMTRGLNISVLYNFIFLFVLAFLAGVIEGVYYKKDDSSATFFEFGSIGGSAPVDGLVTFWAAVILLQNLIPISLYISIEIVKTIQAFFIYSDLGMYYEAIDYPCTPKSWSISDDVGQVEYIFSDKTGTLTQNVMEFRKCTINGVAYGKAFTEAMLGMLKRDQSEAEAESIAEKARQDVSDDKKEMLYELRSKVYDNPYLFDEDVAFVSSQVVRDLVSDSDEAEKAQQKAINEFFLLMALCHTVLPEKIGDRQQKIVYKAQSPDEAALVATAKDLGYTFVEKTRNGMVLDIQGQKQSFQVLCILEFNSTRKRMSAIIQMPDGRIMLFCKGADSVIYERLAPGQQQEMRAKTAADLEEFAKEGLRTLCLAEKELAPAEYAEWSKRHDEAASSIYNRDEKLDAVAEEIEQNLVLVGGTAIEDRLQDGVPDAISLLGRAGIKVWVLTGDKVETAINIGFSCNLLENGMELLILNGATTEEVDSQLTKYLADNFPGLTGSDEDIIAAKKDHSPPGDEFGLVIDGDCLKIIISDESLCKKFVILGKQCKSVLGCRVSPSQKAAVVGMVKNTLDVTTLSVGDGANDVAMILEADVGVGIAGLEGRQAAMSSDYAIGQFRFLKRLVLVHGRWSYYRVAEMTANLFYKNVVFTLTLFWYDVHNSFDGSYLFDYTYITLFNLAFTSLPVIFMGVLDQDVSDEVSLKVPQLYRRGILRQYWTQFKFWVHILDGTYQSAVCYFFAFCVFYNGTFVNMNGLQINEIKSYGVFVATSAIAACNFYVMMNQMRWDWLFLLLVAISTLLVFFWTGIYTQFTASGFFYKNASQVYSSVPFWACTLLQIVVCMLPRFTCKAYQKMFMPYDVDIVREYQYVNKTARGELDEEFPGNEKAPATAVSESSKEGPVFGDNAQLGQHHNDDATSWRDSLRRLSSSGGIRLSVDLPEMTTAGHLMQRMESNSTANRI